MEHKVAKRRVYGSDRWITVRNRRREAYPVCESCGLVLGEECHHVKSWWDYEKKEILEKEAFDYDNIRHICRNCHFRATETQRREKVGICKRCANKMKDDKCGFCEVYYDEG